MVSRAVKLASPAPPEPEHVEDAKFRDLEDQALNIESGAPGGAPGAAPYVQPPPPDPVAIEAEGVRDALLLARQLVAPMFEWWPAFPHVWSDAQVGAIAHGSAAVMVKHGLTFGGIASEYGPYIALGVALLPPCVATKRAIEMRKAELMQQAQQAEQERARQEAEKAVNAARGQTPGGGPVQ